MIGISDIRYRYRRAFGFASLGYILVPFYKLPLLK